MEAYRSRIIDKRQKDELDAMGAVLLEGAKAWSNTSSAEQAANSVIYMDDSGRRNQYLQIVDTAVETMLIVAQTECLSSPSVA